MTGFLVSTAAVLLTAWITWAATYRAAHADGYMKRAAECKAGKCGHVPTGTKHNPLQGVQCNCAVPDPCYNGDTCCTSGNYDRPPYEALAERERQRDALLHVLRDDEIYGRNG